MSMASTTSRCCEWTPIGVFAAAAAAAFAPVFLDGGAPALCRLAAAAMLADGMADGFAGVCCCRWLELSTKVKPSKVSSFEVTLCPSCCGEMRCVACGSVGENKKNTGKKRGGGVRGWAR